MKALSIFKKVFMGIVVSGFGLVCAGQSPVFAASSSMKSVSGEVMGVLNDNISVMYYEDENAGVEKEVLFQVEDTVQFIGRKSLKELSVGDTVLVTYEEIVSADEQGQTTVDRKVQSIKFLKAAPVEEPVDESDAALISEGQ